VTDISKCPHCKGEQWLYEFNGEQVIPKRCICLEKKLLRNYLGTEIYNATWIKSELYCPISNEGIEKIEGDKTKSNLFIKGTWAVICRHLRWVLSAKHLYTPGFTFKIVNDERLVRVWLGAEAYIHKSSGTRNEIETNNSLSDLLAYSDLIIIRLGFISRNKATPNVLYDALRIREFAAKPTWIIEGADSFVPNHCAYNEKVGEYVYKRFERVDLGGDLEAEREEKKAIAAEIEEFGVALGPDIDTPKAHEIETSVQSDNFDILEDSKHNKPHYRPKGRKGGGMSELE